MRGIRRLGCFVVSLLIFAGALWAKEWVRVSAPRGSVHVEADARAQVLVTLCEGDVRELLGREGEWYRVRVPEGRAVGFIHSLFVQEGEERGRNPIIERAGDHGRSPFVPTGARSRGGVKFFAGVALGRVAFDGMDALGMDREEGKRNRRGFAGGIGFQSRGTLGYELDLLYLQKGGRYVGRIDGYGAASLTLKNEEISLPLLLKLRLARGEAEPFLLVGGEVAYILSSKLDWSMEALGKGNLNLKDETKRVDYGLVLGGGLELSFPSWSLTIEGRYHRGAADLKGSDSTGGGKFESRVLLFLMGFKF